MKLCNTFTLNNPQVWLRRSIVPAPSYTPITSSTILDFLHLNYKELINSTCIKTGAVFWPYLAPWSPCHRYPMEEIPEKGDNLNLFTEQPNTIGKSLMRQFQWYQVWLSSFTNKKVIEVFHIKNGPSLALYLISNFVTRRDFQGLNWT